MAILAMITSHGLEARATLEAQAESRNARGAVGLHERRLRGHAAHASHRSRIYNRWYCDFFGRQHIEAPTRRPNNPPASAAISCAKHHDAVMRDSAVPSDPASAS